jgi:hypothetical protein
MWKDKLFRITGLLTAFSFFLILVACGGGSGSTSTSTSTGTGSSNTPRHVQALLQSQGSSSTGVSIPVPGSFISSVLPNISGVSVSLSWSDVDTTTADSSGNYSYTYDFSAFDAALQPYLNSGKMVNLIVWPATEGGNNEPGSGGSTPAYVFSTSYATFVQAHNPQDMVVCGSYAGDASNPYAAAVAGGSGGMWNVSSAVTNAGDLSGLPVSWEPPFLTGYQHFITAVIQHYNGNSAIGYIRFGFSQGGEDSPECNQYWPNFTQANSSGQLPYLAYVESMTDYVKSQNPSMTILADLHSLGLLNSVPAGTYVVYPEAEAQYATTSQFGIGTNGLQQADTTNFSSNQPCDSDWCALFSQYASDEFNSKPITLSLQTLQWSDPTGQTETGSLTVLLPFAASHDCNNLELYLADVALAFDPANYCSYPHSSCSSGGSVYSSADSSSYASAIQSFLGSD